MLRELLSIFRPGDPLELMAKDFAEMLRLAHEMTETAGKIYFGEDVPTEEHRRIYEKDIQVNKFERSLRKQIVTHLSVGNARDLPYTLLLMSLVKDVERLGDYAKNLREVCDVHREPFPEDEITAELREIRRETEESFRWAAQVFHKSDRERALELIHRGKAQAARADQLLRTIARSGHDSATVTAMVLGSRYYKRIGGHILNLLSSVVMPLHKVDYYDEDQVPEDARLEGVAKDDAPDAGD